MSKKRPKRRHWTIQLPDNNQHDLYADELVELETGALRVVGGSPEGSTRTYAVHQWVSYAESEPPPPKKVWSSSSPPNVYSD